MSKFPNKPAKGQPALQAIYNSVCQIIDYLPTLEIRGDNKTISVSHSSVGTTIHANKNFSVTESGKKIYEAGSGLVLSGNVFNVEIDPNTMAIVNNRLSCTIEGGSGEGTDHKYCDNGCNSLIIAAPEDQVNGWNYIGVNPDWIAGNGMCSEGYYAVMSAILKAFSGTNQSTPFAIGSQSIQTMGTEVWVNPWWLCGDTYCQAGYTAVISAVYKYLRSLNPTSEYDTLKYNSQTSSLYWGKDNNDGGGSPTTDYVYAYYDYTGSIIFNSNNPSPYSDPSANAIYINVDWLAGNTECQAGYDAICSAVYKYLTGVATYNATSCTLKINPTDNTIYWGEDIGANQNFLISTGLTSAAVVQEGVTVGTAVRLNSTYTSDLNVITGHSNSNNYNKVLSCNSYGAIGWVTNDAGGGGGYDGNTWYKYADAGNNSLIFSPPYSSENGTTYICINPDWLAGNGEGCCCYEGPAAIASAVLKLMTNPAYSAWKDEFINLIRNSL